MIVHKRLAWGLALIFTICHSQVTASNGGGGLPFNMLQEQIDALREALKSKDAPIEARVHCEYGESVNQVIDHYAYSPNHLWTEVSGKCAEEVSVDRGNVRIRGIDEHTVLSPSQTQSE